MIAFSLVYGDRMSGLPMSVAEIIQNYKGMIPEIFAPKIVDVSDTLTLNQPEGGRFCPYIKEVAPKISPRLHLSYDRAYFCLCPGRYPIEPLIKKLEQTFADDRFLVDAYYLNGAREVYAGACAAKAVQEGTETEIFDATHSDKKKVSIREVLQASCDAHGYFTTPTVLNGRNFEDGGMEGKF